MSELSPHDPQPTAVPDPFPAGFPADQTADALPPLPPAAAEPGEQLLDEPGGADHAPRLAGRSRRGKRLVADPVPERTPLTPPQRLLILDAWVRSGLPAGDFAPLVGLSRHTLYAWKKRFDQLGPAGLTDQPRGAPDGSKLPEVTKRTILLLKQAHPDWGCQKISDLLLRGPALPASAAAVARVLRDAGYALEEHAAHQPHEPPAHRFERAAANQLWQTDLFTFVLDHTS